jgi:hypothetical protein
LWFCQSEQGPIQHHKFYYHHHTIPNTFIMKFSSFAVLLSFSSVALAATVDLSALPACSVRDCLHSFCETIF